MFLKKMFKSITSLNNKIKPNNSALKDPTSTENVQTNYIVIGKLAKNAKIKAEEVLFLMQPKGLLDVSVLDNNNTNLKKAISHKTKKNAYTKTKEELEKLSNGTNSTGTKFQDAKLKKAFGHIAGLFERSLKFKKLKLTGLDSFPKLNNFCRTIMKSNWHIDLKNATTIPDINDEKKKFLENICATIQSTELHQNQTYRFTNKWIEDLSKDTTKLDDVQISNMKPLGGTKHNKLISAAATHIHECIKKAQQKCQKLEETINNINRNVDKFIVETQKSEIVNIISKIDSVTNGSFCSIVLKFLNRNSDLFPYYKRLSGGEKLVEAVDELEKNFKDENSDNKNLAKEFRKHLNDVNFTDKHKYFVQKFNEFKEKFALKE